MADPGSLLTSLGQVRSSNLEEGAQGLPVSVRATVTFCDPERRLLFVQEATGAVLVSADASGPEMNFQEGQLLEIEGATTRGAVRSNVRAQAIRLLGQGTMPAPVDLTRGELLRDAAENAWVQVRGYVPSLVRVGKGLKLELVVNPGVSLELVVLEGDVPAARELAGALVEVSGVFVPRFDASGKKIGGRIYVTNISRMRKLKTLKLWGLRQVANLSERNPPGEPVRFRANVLNHNLGESVLVRDNSGTLRVPYKGLNYFNPESQVEIFAWPVKQNLELVLTNVSIKPIPMDAPNQEVQADLITPATANKNLRPLTQVAQVRKLSAQEASRGYPVHVSGVLTYTDRALGMNFLQDESAGIYVDLNRIDPPPQLRAGQRIDIDGFSGPGDYAPIIIGQQVHAAGEAAFPTPELVTFRKLLTGSYDSQWISLRGVVRSQRADNTLSTLALFTGDAMLKVNVPDPANQPAPMSYIDMAVELQGACATVFDEHRRLQGVEIYVPGWSQLVVKDNQVRDPFTLPVKAITSLLQFQASGGELHRTRVMGIVILKLRDGSFYLQDASGGLQVQPQESAPALRVGTTVDLVGFPVVIDGQPVLQDAIARSVKGGTPVEPVELKPDAVQERMPGTLVRVEGQVLGHFSRAGEELLTVQSGQSILDVVLEKKQGQDQLAAIEPGTRVRLTGVYLARPSSTAKIQSFELLLRGPADVTVVSRPSWWTVKHALYALAALGAVFVLSLVWVSALQRQVSQRTRELHEEIEQHKRTEAKLEGEIVERRRMEAEVERSHQELLTASRRAGMAEVASSVLHNVGNVLNSVNVSVHLLVEKIKGSKVTSLPRLADLIGQHSEDLAGFFRNDPRGQQLPDYLVQLASHLAAEQQAILEELDSLTKNLEHIKQIVSTQQSYAKAVGLTETIEPAVLVEDALRINSESLARDRVEICREYAPHLPKITVDKHKALQVLVNLIRNARVACDEAGRPDKRLTVRLANGEGRLAISVIDNGVGIASENLTRIFNHGFTTRTDGHGFGLHSGAIAAQEMGGSLQAQSDGLGKGATFTLELPVSLS